MRAAVLACVAGVWGLQQLAALPSIRWLWLLPVGAVSIWMLPSSAGWQAARRLAWLLLCVALGFGWALWRADLRLADALSPQWSGMDVQLEGVVAGLPQAGAHGERFGFDVLQVLTPGAVVPQHVRLVLSGQNGNSSVRPGQRWRWTVRLWSPHASENPHVADAEAGWFASDVRAFGVVLQRPVAVLVDARAHRLGDWIDRLRAAIDARFDRVPGTAPYAGVLKALAVGDQSTISTAQWQLFQHTGIVHLVSISGSHVTLLAGMIYAGVLWLWRASMGLSSRLAAQRAAALGGALAALGYVALAGWGIPAQRTLVMLWVAALAQWSGRGLAPTRMLALALLAVCVFDPWAVLAPGFWLSFGAVGLLLFVSAARVGTVPPWRQWWRAQWAVTLGLAPLLLGWFDQVSLVSPLANAVAIPLVEMLVTPLTLAGCVPGFDVPLHWAATLCGVLVWWLRLLDRWPVWQPAIPATGVLVLLLAGVFWSLLPRGMPARWLGGLVWLPVLFAPAARPDNGALWVDVLDVGQGLAVALRTRHHAWLFDTGPPGAGGGSDSGERIVLPWLRGEGVGRLDALVLSHDDNDHTGGARSVLSVLPAGEVLTSLPRGHGVLSTFRGTVVPCVQGQTWVADGVRFAVLHPSQRSYADSRLRDNHRSCVLRAESAGGSVLVAADIEAADESQMVAAYGAELHSMLLVAPHHGSRTSSTTDFIAAVRPAWVIFTVGAHNRFGHPHGEVVARYRAQGCALWRSDRAGLVAVRFSPHRPPQISAWRVEHQRYWMDGVNERSW